MLACAASAALPILGSIAVTSSVGFPSELRPSALSAGILLGFATAE